MGNRSTGILDDGRPDPIWNKIIEAVIKDNNIKDNISEYNEWLGNIFLRINVSARSTEEKEYHRSVDTPVPSKDQVNVSVIIGSVSKGIGIENVIVSVHIVFCVYVIFYFYLMKK